MIFRVLRASRGFWVVKRGGASSDLYSALGPRFCPSLRALSKVCLLVEVRKSYFNKTSQGRDTAAVAERGSAPFVFGTTGQTDELLT